jgi:hypothetical protein
MESQTISVSSIPARKQIRIIEDRKQLSEAGIVTELSCANG